MLNQVFFRKLFFASAACLGGICLATNTYQGAPSWEHITTWTTGNTATQVTHGKPSSSGNTDNSLNLVFQSGDPAQIDLHSANQPSVNPGNRLGDDATGTYYVGTPYWTSISVNCSAGTVSVTFTYPSPLTSGWKWMLKTPGYAGQACSTTGASPATCTFSAPPGSYSANAGLTTALSGVNGPHESINYSGC